MGRSVSTPSGTVYVAYAALDTKAFWCDECGEHFNELRTEQELDEDGDETGREFSYCPHCGAGADVHVHSNDVQDDFDWALEDFQRQMLEAFPSMTACDEWPDREDHALAENRFCQVGVSEYCGLVAMWMREKDGPWYGDAGWEALRDRWLSQVQQRFRKAAQGCFGQALCSVGRASNGEQFFQPMNGRQQGAIGLGYTSKEGWL